MGQLLIGFLTSLVVFVVGMLLLLSSPDGFHILIGTILFAVTMALLVFLWRRFRVVFWGFVFLPALCVIGSLCHVVVVKTDDIKTSPAELIKNKANFNYRNLNFSGVWVLVPDENITRFGYWSERKIIKVKGDRFRYETEIEGRSEPFAVVYDGKVLHDNLDRLKNSRAASLRSKDPQYWRDEWEFHPKGFLSRKKDIKTIAGREAVRFEGKSLFGSTNTYWVDSATGVVLRTDGGYECKEIIYAPVGEETFQKL